MAKKQKGLKRSKPSYIYSIIGVSLVLLILGIMGWIFLNFQQVSNNFKESVKVQAFFTRLRADSINQIRTYIEQQPYAKDVIYIDTAKAAEIFNKDNNEDWRKVLTENPFPESIEFSLKSGYVNNDSLAKISATITQLYGNVISELKYPKNMVNTLNTQASKFGLILLVVGVILSVIVIFSIDNTIRLAMFSNRFLIKTMQMVGATRWFIARPMNIRAIINGLISAAIASLLLFFLIQWAENNMEQLRAIRDTRTTIILFGSMAVVGICISLISTHRSVIKYLKMRLDDLY